MLPPDPSLSPHAWAVKGSIWDPGSFSLAFLHAPCPLYLTLAKPAPKKRVSPVVSFSRGVLPSCRSLAVAVWALRSECRVAVVRPQASGGSGREL